MKAAEWIDRLKTEKGWESDYRVAKELGVGRATVSKYRSLQGTLDDETAVRVAQALDLEPNIIILDQVAERTKSEPARASLAELLARLTKPGKKGPLAGGGAAAVGEKGRLDISSLAYARVGVTPGGAPEDAPGRRAAAIHIVSSETPPIKTSVIRLMEVLGNWLMPPAAGGLAHG